MTAKQRFVPSRANSDLLDLVNKQRKADRISWPGLIETLFHSYLKKGLPELGRRPKRPLKKNEQ